MRVLIVNNVRAGANDGYIFDFMRHLAEEGDVISLRNIGPGHGIREILEDASEFDLVVASGGDGTVAGVSYELRNTGIPILPFPSGTSNALSMNIDSPTEPHALAKLAREGSTMDFDMGQISVGGKTYGFNLVAGCGYDATIMSKAVGLKSAIGSMAYFTAALTNPLPTNAKFRIVMDDQEIERIGVGLLVCNFSKLQFELPLVPENKPRDGYLDVAVLGTNNAVELIPGMISNMLENNEDFKELRKANEQKNGAKPKAPKHADPSKANGLEYFRAKHVEVYAEPDMPVQFDGEPLDVCTPIVLDVIPKCNRYVVSENCLKLFGSN